MASIRSCAAGPAAALAGLAAMGLILTGTAPASGPTGIDWAEQPLEVARGEAFQGRWRMNDSDFRYVDAPSAALDDDGTASVAWVDQADQELYFQRYAPDGEALLDEPVNVSGSPEIFSWLPRVILADDDPDTVYIAWQEIIFSGGSHGGEILFARSGDGGRSFSEPVNLSDTTAGAGKGRLTVELWDNGSLDLAAGPAGTVYVAWTEYQGRLRLARSRDRGKSFSEPVHVAGGDDRPPARGPSLAVGDDGRVHLAWTVGENPQADIRYARSDDGGQSFGQAMRVGASEHHADAPSLAVTDDGTVHLVYAESTGWPRRPGDIRYSRRAPDAGFTEPRPISSTQSETHARAGFPDLAAAGGALYVLWERYPEPGSRPRGLGLTRSADGGDSFSAAEIVPYTADPEIGFNGSLQGLLTDKLAVNRSGDIAVVNSSFRPGRVSRVRLIRGRAADDR